MWKLLVFVCWLSWVESLSRTSRQSYNGHGWDIRLAVPGEPGSDYPTLGAIPRTSFSCAGKEPGYYADLETSCQVFRICTTGSTYGFQSFLCPNGTLFNQAVFVCDWWMNVNCQRSQELFNINNDKFGNLKLGPQLMKDIKKMLTHPMRNPYDKSVMKSNLIVMQDYRPPFGQMFPNGALIASTDRAPNRIYASARQIQNYNQNDYRDSAFIASTPSAQYVPPFNTITQQGDAEVFQRQRQNGQYTQNGKLINAQQSGNLISNGHAGQFTQTRNTFFNNGNSLSRPTQNYHAQYNQRQTNFGNTQSFNAQNALNNQRGQLKYSQYTDNTTPQANNGIQREFGLTFSKQQYNYNNNQDKTHSNENIGQINQAKQNLVSNTDVPATIVTKTLTFNRIIQDPKPGQPKSRITFKTWIVKPSKSARVIADPNAYTYDKPTQPPPAKLIQSPTPYVYNAPATQPQTQPPPAKLIQAPTPYVYNAPVTQPQTQPPPAKLIQAPTPYIYNAPPTQPQTQPPPAKLIQSPTSYVYNAPPTQPQTARIMSQAQGSYMYQKPTIAAKQIVAPVRVPSRLYLNPTAPPPTLSGRLYLAPTSPSPTIAARLIAPTTYKPAAKLYIPPSQSNLILSRQYLAPSAIQQPAYYQSEQLRASPTTPTPVYAAPPNNENGNNPSFSLTKHSRINTNHNNLTFSDILTKEKLDITVNDIVSDTSKVLKTATPQFEQYRQDKSADYADDNYLPSDHNESDEKLTSQAPSVSTSSRLIVDPSRNLEPPVESHDNDHNNQNSNPLSNLPFYKEPSTNTIERTVSLKISIPEKVASYLFKSRNESDFDKLEILNTGSSNYLVLTNNLIPKATNANFIPIGRLIADKNSNISDSQALVFSFLADSLNAAKEYSHIAQQNAIFSTSAQQNVISNSAQYQNVNNEDLSHITNQISQLTASQYSANNHNFNQANTVLTSQTGTNSNNQYGSAKYTNHPQNQPQQIQNAQINAVQQNGPRYSTQGNNLQDGQIYSGQLYQLPVPDVTSQIYNAGPAKVIQSQHHSTEADHLHEGNQNSNTPKNNLGKQSSEVETVHSQIAPARPAKLKSAFSNEHEFNSQEQSTTGLNFLNNGDGISAQVRDKIIGTIQHPSEENKLVTYKKDQSYYVFTKIENSLGDIQNNNIQSNIDQNANLIQNTNTPNIVSFQFVPSVSYQLDDEKEQQKLLNAFHLDQYGNPKGNLVQSNQNVHTGAEVDYSVEHPTSSKQVDGQFNDVNTLYTGPSSYSAPQASVGNLKAREENPLNNLSARLEHLGEHDNGYAKVIPARQFSF